MAFAGMFMILNRVIAAGPPDGSSAERAALSGYQLASDYPDKSSDYYWIKSPTMPNALLMWVDMDQEGGGYDFYAFQGNGTSVNSVNATNSGIALGLDLIMPRSKQHWIAMSNFVRNATGRSPLSGSYGSYFRTVYGVHRTTTSVSGGNYTNKIMRDPNYYGSGAPDWKVKDGGRWWLRNSKYKEPNGDYNFGALLINQSFPNPYTGADIGLNDRNSSYYTGNYYLVSTNAKP